MLVSRSNGFVDFRVHNMAETPHHLPCSGVSALRILRQATPVGFPLPGTLEVSHPRELTYLVLHLNLINDSLMDLINPGRHSFLYHPRTMSHSARSITHLLFQSHT